MKGLRFIVAITLGLCLMGQTSWAAKAYVTDTFEITLRTGPSNQNRVIALPRSGQSVEILESKDNWSRVRLLEHRQGKLEGWIMSRYLITRQPWENQARSLRRENGYLKEKLARIEEQLKGTASREQGGARELKKNIIALNKLQNEHKTLKRGSANYLKLKEEHEGTLTTLEASQRDVATLTRENDRLRSAQSHMYFGMGAVVLLFGFILGLAIGKREKKRRSTLIYE